MPIDDMSSKEVVVHPSDGSSHTTKFIAVFVILALMVIGEVYTLTQMSAMRTSLEAQQAAMQRALSSQVEQQISTRISALEASNAQQLQAVKEDLDNAAKRLGRNGVELRRARAMVEQLQTTQQQQADELKQQIAQKADQQQVGALSQDLNSQRTDLDTTKKTVSTISNDLGMARSELGNLIARNHQDVEYLRKLGERDYFEFTLTRNRPSKVANVELILKKTNVKRHRFDMALVADEMQIDKKGRTVNEPVIFYIGGSKRPFELVVNSVQSNQVKGYVSTPKGAVEVATRSEGSR
ncbi:MAG: hypothetical protein LAP13_00195 [Acidobacteriia bacterium]|nr:hypothetical protein [Terriglobia bacterium]